MPICEPLDCPEGGATLRAQWEQAVPPTDDGTLVGITRTIPEDPAACVLEASWPTARPPSGLWDAWARTQLAADAVASRLGSRPLVALVRWGRRWLPCPMFPRRTVVIAPAAARSPIRALGQMSDGLARLLPIPDTARRPATDAPPDPGMERGTVDPGTGSPPEKSAAGARCSPADAGESD